ncbi:MAG: hypothetical protein JWP87_4876 [Labilithrix sp.]|nr:hypothetical protein [Labilithrix sp.]
MKTIRFALATMIMAAFAATGCTAEADPDADDAPAPSVELAHAVEPEAKKHCHVLSMEDWWVVTGNVSEYGGTLCH